MGVSEERNVKFFSEHPYCCFCGGDTLATTKDHVPSRYFFNNREWPEGFLFPACESCQIRTKPAENFCAQLSKFLRPWGYAHQEQEVQNAEIASRREFPEIWADMPMSNRAKRNAIRDRKLPRSNGPLSDYPLIKFNKRANELVIIFHCKLACALYYRHTGKIVKLNQSLSIEWFTNEKLASGEPAIPAGHPFYRIGEIKRGPINFLEQFDYVWNSNAEGDLFSAAVAFGDAHAAILAVWPGPRKFIFPTYDIFGTPTT